MKIKAILVAALLAFSPAIASAADVVSSQPVRIQDVAASGSLTALNGAVTVTPNSVSSVNIGVSGTFTATLTFEGTIDGTNYYPISGVPISGGNVVQTVSAPGAWTGTIAGFASFRVRVSAFTSGTAVVTLRVGQGPGTILCVSGCSTTITYNATPPTLTNGTTAPLQSDVNGNLLVVGTNTNGAIAVKQTRDFNRTRIVFYGSQTTSGTPSTFVSFNMASTKNGVTGLAATTYTVATGKTLRLTSLSFTSNGTTTATNCTLRLHFGTVTGPIEDQQVLPTGASLGFTTTTGFAGDGIEFASTNIISFDAACAIASSVVSFVATGFEY